MVAPIFQQREHQELFDRQGYIVLPFLDAEEVAALDALFDELHPDISPDRGFVSGSYSSDYAYKKRASDAIVSMFSRHYARLFQNYLPFGAAFLYKAPNNKSELAVHQDWTIVDEERYVALNCWVPLTDVTADNGALGVVPGTHYNNVKTLRAPTLPFFFSGNDDLMEQAAIPMSVPAGHAVILNQSVIHGSPPNRSNKIRKAITAGVKSAGAPMIFHYRDLSDPAAAIERFDMPEDFLISFDNFMQDILQRPKMGSSAGHIDARVEPYSREQLAAMLGITLPEPPQERALSEPTLVQERPTLFQRIAKLFTA